MGGQDRPPAGAAIRPKLAHNVDPFYAFAFDADRSEFYTVGARPDPKSSARVLGVLRRYTYPDCKQKTTAGEFNLPNLAVRASIDSKKGVLFVASATNQYQKDQLFMDGFDRAHAYGDIHVYDLEPIRAGKVGDGDLKPMATMAQGGQIKGMELSSDNRFLYVVVTKPVPGGQPKSHLKQYDAAERKLVKEITLPEQAADMQLSANGKHLVVFEFDSTQRKTSVQIRTYDAETLAPAQNFNAGGVVTDVGSNPDGGLVVATAGPPAQVNGPPSLTTGKLHAIDAGGGKEELLITGWRASHGNYAKFSPDGSHLIVSSFAGRDQKSGAMQNAGVDVYVPDKKNPSGYRKAASIRSAIGFNRSVMVGGYFNITPDGANVLFHNGAVISIATIAKNAEGADSVAEPGGNAGGGLPGAGGFPGAGGLPMPGGPGALPMPGGPGALPLPGGPGALPLPGGPGALPLPGGPGALPMPGGPGALPPAPPPLPGAPPQPGGPGGAMPPPAPPPLPGKPPRPGM